MFKNTWYLPSLDNGKMFRIKWYLPDLDHGQMFIFDIAWFNHCWVTSNHARSQLQQQLKKLTLNMSVLISLLTLGPLRTSDSLITFTTWPLILYFGPLSTFETMNTLAVLIKWINMANSVDFLYWYCFWYDRNTDIQYNCQNPNLTSTTDGFDMKMTLQTPPTTTTQTFQALLDELESWNLAQALTRPIWFCEPN